MESFKAIVLDIKLMNYLILREYGTPNYHRFTKFEQLIQSSYDPKKESSNRIFKIGTYVVVYMTLDAERGTKRWLRGVVRQNYNQMNHFFGVYLLDYGFEKTCLKSDMRPLNPYHSPKYFPIQAFNFYLTDVDHKSGVKREDVIKEVKNLLEQKEFIITITVEGRDRKGSIYGSIIVEEDCDLAAILLEKQLVEDVHYCSRSRRRSETETSDSSSSPSRPPGPFRSAHKAGRVHCDLVCKCNDIIKYKRKLMRDVLKENCVQKESREQRFANSL